MVLVKKWDIFHVFIVGKIGKEKVSVDILGKKKRLFRLYNKGVKKKEEKFAFSQRGLVHGFAPKKRFFPRFYFWQNRH